MGETEDGVACGRSGSSPIGWRFSRPGYGLLNDAPSASTSASGEDHSFMKRSEFQSLQTKEASTCITPILRAAATDSVYTLQPTPAHQYAQIHLIAAQPLASLPLRPSVP